MKISTLCVISSLCFSSAALGNSTSPLGTKSLWLQDFGNDQSWRSYNQNPRHVADVNGDNKADIIGFASDGVYVSLSNGSGFNSKTLWLADFASNQSWNSFDANPRMLADVNGDNKADIIGFASDGVYVSLSNGNGFNSKTLWLADFASQQSWTSFDKNPRMIADVNGDNKADLVGFASDGVYVSLSDGQNFSAKQLWIADFAINQTWTTFNTNPRLLADVNGDNKADIVGFGHDGPYVALSDGSAFQEKSLWLNDFGIGQTWYTQSVNPRMLGKLDRCHGLDLIGFSSTGTEVSLSDKNQFSPRQHVLDDFGYNQTWYSFDVNPRVSADVNGDGLDDVIGFGAQGAWVSLAVD